MPTIQKHDFIEVDFTGRFADGAVFDTTSKEIAEKNNVLDPGYPYKPVIICVGERQLLPGLDDALVGKEIGGSFTITLQQEQAFGKKDVKKIRIIPKAQFIKENINPQPGLAVTIDGEMGAIMRESGGRMLVNFNHPYAGKEVTYEVKINRLVEDKKEQVECTLTSIFHAKVPFEIKDAALELSLKLPPEVQVIVGNKIKELVKIESVVFKE